MNRVLRKDLLSVLYLASHMQLLDKDFSLMNFKQRVKYFRLILKEGITSFRNSSYSPGSMEICQKYVDGIIIIIIIMYWCSYFEYIF
jgi:hypothetical protein